MQRERRRHRPRPPNRCFWQQDLGPPLIRAAENGQEVRARYSTQMRIQHPSLAALFIPEAGLRYAIGSACIGGGQGIAVLLQRV